MKYLASILIFFSLCSSAQPLPFDQRVVDSITHQLPFMRDDTNKVKNLIRLSQMYIAKGNGDLVLQYAHEADSISKKIQYNLGRISALMQMGFYHATTGNWPQSLIELNEAIPLTHQEKTDWSIAIYNLKFINYATKNDFKAARMWALRALHHPTFQNLDEMGRWPTYMQLGLSYEWENQLDSAQYYADILKDFIKKYHHTDLEGNTHMLFGNIARKKKQYDEALHYYRLGEPNFLGIAWVYDEQNRADSAIHYAKLALDVAQAKYDPRTILESSQILARHYAKTDPSQSNKYLQLYVNTKDTLFNAQKMKELEDIRLNEQSQRFEQIGREKSFRSKTIQYSLMGLAALFLVSALFFFRNNQIKKVANAQLEKSNSELKIVQTDLEGKNRDLEIETALDKIRSASLAMHHSNELEHVVAVFYEKLKDLGLVFDGGTGIHIFTEGSKDAVIWVFAALQPPSKINLPFDADAFINNTIILDVWNAHNTGTHIFNKYYSFEEKNRYFNYVFKHNDYNTIPEEVRNFILSVPNYTASFITEKHSLLGANSWTGQLFSELDFEILKRVAKVFEQAYIRFLDLQKAEVQAREGQIELALERVRSRTMAMQKSDELAETSLLLDSQVRELGIKTRGCGFNIYGENESTEWFSSELGTMPTYKTPREHFFLSYYEAGQRGETLLLREFAGEECVAHYDYLCSLPVTGEGLRQFKANGGSFPTQQIDHVAYFKYGYLLFITLESVPEAHDVFKRFAKVFEQTFTRFLDLQKAEAQAREAQIEAALEKVRSRSLAMHHSNELAEAASILFQQVTNLGVNAFASVFHIWQPDGISTMCWANGGDGMQPPLRVPHIEESFHRRIYDAWQRGEGFFVMESEGAELEATYRFLYSLIGGKTVLDNIEDSGFVIPKKQVTHCAFFLQGYIMFNTYEKVQISHDIFKRFAKVFEQTYTRFLDLQKAEAQAREAQIEAALEKVRSASLAMHHTDELEKVVMAVSERLADLGLQFDGSLIFIFDSEKRNILLWTATIQYPAPLKIHLPFEPEMENNPIWKMLWHAIETGEHVINKTFSGKEKDDYFRYVQKNNPKTLPIPEEELQLELPDLSVTLAAGKNALLSVDNWSGKVITEDEFQILIRFAKVFQQAYTRFLDLQKAEAQVREAQIQLSLERIRAKAMAMQHSDELSDFLTVVFEQFEVLNLNPVNCHLSFLDIDNNRSIFRLTGKNGARLIATQEIDLDASTVWKQKIEDWKSGHPSDVDVLFIPFDRLPEIGEIFKEILSKLPEDDRPLPEDYPDGQYIVDGYCKYGYLGYSASKPPSDEEKEIIRRIANEFGNVYQRFLDLQKAEAQAREAQIEVSLERIRSRTMAMHNSSELTETANLLFKQVQALGIPAWSCGYNVFAKDEKECIGWMSTQDLLQPPFRIPLSKSPTFIRFYESKQNNEEFYVETVEGKDLEAHYKYMLSLPDFKEIAERHVESGFSFPTFQMNHVVNFKQGNLIFITGQPIPESHDVLKRFAAVFEQTYIRFLDLKKAEAQARENEIELALERVRAKTMSIQQSSELREIVAAMYEQLRNVGFTFGACSIVIMDKLTGNMDWWIHGFETPYPESYQNSYFEHPFYLAQLNHWKDGKKYAVMETSGADKKAYDDYVFSKTDFVRIPIETQNVMKSFEKITFSNAYMKYGALSWSTEPLDDTHAYILQRFAYVFEQSYTRFLDLKKAEAQAREAQIEVALERIRSRSLAMHNANELKEVMAVMFEKLTELEVLLGTVAVQIFDTKTKSCEFWVGNERQAPAMVKLPYDENIMNQESYMKDCWQAHDTGTSFFNKIQSFEEKNNYFNYVFANNDTSVILPPVREFILQAENHSQNLIIEKNSALFFDSWSEKLYSESQIDVLKRVAKVFEQAYIRFLDLQKAEAQAREGQIEIALERVRSKTMAMQKSENLIAVINEVAEQLLQLNFRLDTASFFLNNESEEFTFWLAAIGESNPDKIIIPKLQHPVLDNIKKAQEKGLDFFADTLTFEEKNAWFQHVFDHSVTNRIPEDRKKYLLNTEGYARSVVLMKHIGLFIVNFVPQPYNDEDNTIFKRFAFAFEQAYIRFLDLQKAEAQAREAQIELALERVRSKSISMTKTDEIRHITSLLFSELRQLDLTFDRSVIITIDADLKGIVYWLAGPEGLLSQNGFRIPMFEHPFNQALIDNFKNKTEKWVFKLEDENKKEWDDIAFDKSDLRHLPDFIKDSMINYGNVCFSMSSAGFGFLMISGREPVNELQFDIIVRFSKVFDQTYTRFLDIQKAEAQAREAKIEVALEKIRASALAMDSSSDFHQVVKTLREQLLYLGQKEWEASIIQFYHPDKGYIESWQIQNTDSDTNSSQIGISRLLFDACRLTKRYLNEYLLPQDEYTIISVGEELEEWKDYLISLSPEVEERIRAAKNEIIYMHHSKFSAGALVMVSQTQPNEESKNLQKRAASVFDLAYTRFLDLQLKEQNAIKLFEEKQKLEQTLSELRSTQAQLIQKEKLASLGELTAGIAHEIQNPLNFVNNFSELSVDLVQDLKDEFKKSEKDEAYIDELFDDLSQNQKKINHHGKRASSIVKGMLEHSRTSTGERALTDINALADEYLRLSYHGMRAKDKNFNADYKMEFDTDLPKINIVSQDIGRVLLNLLNNAFYAVNEKKKQNTEGGYQPIVTVETRCIASLLEIKIKDNGNGMPEAVKAKVFQPFFTTKPTGEGTGLGLSLAYDIVTKGHGGTFEVETNEEVGSEFIIQLPLKNI